MFYSCKEYQLFFEYAKTFEVLLPILSLNSPISVDEVIAPRYKWLKLQKHALNLLDSLRGRRIFHLHLGPGTIMDTCKDTQKILARFDKSNQNISLDKTHFDKLFTLPHNHDCSPDLAQRGDTCYHLDYGYGVVDYKVRMDNFTSIIQVTFENGFGFYMFRTDSQDCFGATQKLFILPSDKLNMLSHAISQDNPDERYANKC